MTKKGKANPTCGYCLRGTEELVKIECTPDGGRTWIYPILACAPCRAYLSGVYRIHKDKAEPKNQGVFADLEKWFSKKHRAGDRFIVTMMGSAVYEWDTEAGKK